MVRIQLSALPLLFISSLLCAGAQTRAAANPRTVSDQQSAASKTKGPIAQNDTRPYSKAELQQRSADAKKYYKLGVKYGRAMLFRQATELFLRSIRLKPDYTDAYFDLGHAYYELGRWEDSISAFEKVVELNPKNKEAFARLGAAHQKLRAEQRAKSKAESSSPTGEKATLSLSADPGSKPKASELLELDTASLVELYKVGVGDVLEIRLREAPADQAILFTVTATGFLEYPLLHQPLKVIGLTPEEISQKLKESLKERSRSAEVSIAVREYKSHAILVSGLVKEPGTKLLRREAIPLYVVLADAQPLPEAAQVMLVSRQAAKPVSMSLGESQRHNLLVRPGDVITVQAAPRQYFYVGGEVKNPGEKLFRAGMTLTQAILSAGGVTEKGRNIELGRESVGGLLATTGYKLKDINSGKLQDRPIQPGDRIVVVH